jgi:hypothetical protein
MMRRPAVGLTIVALFAGGVGVFACSTFGASADPPQPTPDASAPPEAPILQFSCGTTECVAGSHACCQVTGMFACYGIDAGGCPSASGLDAGPDAAPPGPSLLCTTYRNCDRNRNQKCCYRADRGASCQDRCDMDFASLCRLDQDTCGDYANCNTLPNSPAANVGQCTGSSGTSGWGGGGGFP